MKMEKSCGAVITRGSISDLQILVIHQVQGHWAFPKGHVEGNETELETASREICEETGLIVRFDSGFRKTRSYSPGKGVMKEVVYFSAHPIGGVEKVQEKEVLEMKWVDFNHAAALLTYDSDAELLKDVVSFLKKNKEF